MSKNRNFKCLMWPMQKEGTRLKMSITKGTQQRGIPVASLFDHPALGRIVDIDYPKALGIALGPLKIVHQRPDKVAAQWGSLLDGLGASGDMRAQIVDAPGIADPVAAVPDIGESRAVLGHIEIAYRIVAPHIDQQIAQTARIDLPAHIILAGIR